LELEHAAVDPLDHAHDGPEGTGDECRDGSGPADGEPDGGDCRDEKGPGRDTAEVDELRLSVRRLAVVRLDLLDRGTLAVECLCDASRVAGSGALVDQAEQFGRARDHEIEADLLPHA